MKRIAAVVVGALVFLVMVLTAFVASRPSEFQIERSTTMDVPASYVLDQVDDFHAFLEWNPWQDLDPDQTVTFGGPDAGVGAWYTWSGDNDVGRGRMEILEVVDLPETKQVVYALEFMEPMQAHNRTVISMEPTAAGTRVTWSMSGENDFMGKLFSMVMDVDGMVGADFERGLQQLATQAGAAEQAATSGQVAATPSGETHKAAGDTDR